MVRAATARFFIASHPAYPKPLAPPFASRRRAALGSSLSSVKPTKTTDGRHRIKFSFYAV